MRIKRRTQTTISTEKVLEIRIDGELCRTCGARIFRTASDLVDRFGSNSLRAGDPLPAEGFASTTLTKNEKQGECNEKS